MGLLDRFGRRGERAASIQPLSFSDYLAMFGFGGNTYTFVPQQTLTGTTEEIARDFAGMIAGAYESNGVVFACELARLMLFTEARFQWRRLANGRPGDLFGTPDLAILEKPWRGGTTGDLLGRMLLDADFGGTGYVVRRPDRLARLRPDWLTVVYGSDTEDPSVWDVDAEVIGYVYQPGGPAGGRDRVVYLPEQVAHFAPIPHPLRRDTGMPWLLPIIAEVMGDKAATEHKLRFFEKGATVNLVVTMDPTVTRDTFDWFKEKFAEEHEGLANAYKTLFLGGGATATPVGANMREQDFKNVQGAGETRIAAAAGVPPVIVGLSEGLQAATYSNYGQARRRFADGTMWPLWRNVAGSLEAIVPPPDAAAQLWVDARDIPFLREDEKDQATIQSIQAQSIKSLVDAGFEAETVIAAVTSGDFNKLVHTHLFSVQLQPPMPEGGASLEVQAARALAALVAQSTNGHVPELGPAVTGEGT